MINAFNKIDFAFQLNCTRRVTRSSVGQNIVNLCFIALLLKTKMVFTNFVKRSIEKVLRCWHDSGFCEPHLIRKIISSAIMKLSRNKNKEWAVVAVQILTLINVNKSSFSLYRTVPSSSQQESSPSVNYFQFLSGC